MATKEFPISDKERSKLLEFLKKNPSADAVEGYCAFIELKYQLKPVLYVKDKTLYISLDDLKSRLESQGKLYRETEITIHFGTEKVNNETKKIYLCPFCSMVIGDNAVIYDLGSQVQPIDAMYGHVSKCQQNKEIVDGLPAKRFLVSEDPEMIKGYITQRKAAVKKTVFTSGTGKLFNSRDAVIEEFKKAVKPMTFFEVVQNTRGFDLEESLAEFNSEHVVEDKIIAFLKSLSTYSEFDPYVKRCQEE